MRFPILRTTIALVLLSVILVGCFGRPVTPRRLYVLEYLPEARGARLNAPPHEVSLLVRDFAPTEVYRRPELARRLSAHEVTYDWNHRWAVRPEKVVTDMVRRHLRAVNLVSDLQDQYTEDQPDFEFEGVVMALEEFRTPASRWAHLALEVRLLRSTDRRIHWKDHCSLRQQVWGEETVLVIRALSQLLEICNDRFVAGLDSALTALGSSP